jgi:hypothetical protein
MDRVFALEDCRRRLGLTLIASLFALMPSPLAAQNAQPPLSELVPRLYNDTLIRNTFVFREVFGPRAVIEEAPFDTALSIIDLAGDQLSSFPLPSSAGSFTWSFDQASGTFNRASNSFGPIYADRAVTIGRRHANFGVAYQRVTFDRLNDQPLKGGAIITYTGVANAVGGTGFFAADSLDIDVRTDTTVMFATFGLTDRWDAGIAVPYNHVNINARLTTRIGNTRTGVDPEFAIDDERSGSARGIGDIVARTKFNFLKRQGGGLAAALDLRLPTGDETNLLGVAGAQAKLFLIASTAVSKVSPHVNVGYTWSGSSAAATDPNTIVIAPPDEVNYAGGVDVETSLRATLAFDVVGRTLKRFGTLERVPTVFGPNYLQLSLQEGKDLNLLLGSTGIKVNPFGNMLITGNMLFPMTSGGLTDNLTWMVGIDYSF